jgi:hypothetical protein
MALDRGGGREHLADRTRRERFADRLRPLGEEEALLVAVPPAMQPPGSNDPG